MFNLKNNFYEESEKKDLKYFRKFMEVLHRGYAQITIPHLTGCLYYPSADKTTFDMMTMNALEGQIATLEFKSRTNVDNYPDLFIEPKKLERRLNEWNKYRVPSMYINFIEHDGEDGWEEVYLFFTHNYPEPPKQVRKSIKDKGAMKTTIQDRCQLLKKHAIHFKYDRDSGLYSITLPSTLPLNSNEETLRVVNISGADAYFKENPDVINNKILDQLYKKYEKTKNIYKA